MIKDFSLLSLLKTLGDEYILLRKQDEFPSFLPGSDIDLLVIDRFDASEKIQKYLNQIFKGDEMFLRVTEGNNHIHLDINHDNDIWVRIDLIDNLEIYTRFTVQDALKIKLFLSRETVLIDSQEIFVPSFEYDLLIRYFEYLEWFEMRPDKIKHLDYILANSTKEQRLQLIKDAHRYIRFHHLHWKEETISKNYINNSRSQAIKEIIRLVKSIMVITWDRFRSKVS